MSLRSGTPKGGGLGTQAVLIVGVSSIVADGLSMGLGEYLSSKAMNEYMAIERKREEWELANHRQVQRVSDYAGAVGWLPISLPLLRGSVGFWFASTSILPSFSLPP